MPADYLAERLNVETPLFKNCTGYELTTLIIASFLSLAPLLTLAGWSLGYPFLGFGASALATLLATLIGATILQRVKRNRPDGYYQQKITLLLVELGLKKSSFIYRSGYWHIQR